MTRTARILVCTLGLLTAILVASAFAVDAEPPSRDGAAITPPAGVMEQMMPDMMGMMVRNRGKAPGPASCPKTAMPRHMAPMDQAPFGRMGMGHGMMRRMMDHYLFLDRVQELGLSPAQVEKLRMIRSACRKDNIRSGAEAKIAQLDLQDLLSQDDWSVEDAEKLVRKREKLEGDRLVRHLQAVAEARKVSTPDQLKKATADSADEPLESLF